MRCTACGKGDMLVAGETLTQYVSAYWRWNSMMLWHTPIGFGSFAADAPAQ